MDEQVLRAMARWPDVPAVFGWLRLDRRGTWHLIDRGQPGFDEARDGRGSPITSPPIIDFIHRNYTHDAAGRWFWQNGPQRVFVDLDCAPLVLRVLGESAGVRFVTHTGDLVNRVDAAWSDPSGAILLATDRGPGVIHDLDLGALALSERADGQIACRLGNHVLRIEAIEPLASGAGFIARPRP